MKNIYNLATVSFIKSYTLFIIYVFIKIEFCFSAKTATLTIYYRTILSRNNSKNLIKQEINSRC